MSYLNTKHKTDCYVLIPIKTIEMTLSNLRGYLQTVLFCHQSWHCSNNRETTVYVDQYTQLLYCTRYKSKSKVKSFPEP